MIDKDEQRLHRHLDRFERKLPETIARWIAWLRRPAARVIRIPIGVLLIIGGIFSFLPVLGLWMLPLGVLLLAVDVSPLRRPTGRAAVRGQRLWAKWRRRRAGQ